MLVLSRKRDEVVVIVAGDVRVEVMVADIRGDKVRLGFIAPDGVTFIRKELLPNENDSSPA